jgi:hypothetical protein
MTGGLMLVLGAAGVCTVTTPFEARVARRARVPHVVLSSAANRTLGTAS